MASAALFWTCLTQVLVEIALRDGPVAALRWAPGRADLLAGAAEIRADAASGPADYAAASRQAREALRRGPMEDTALLVLALDADRNGQRTAAARLMSAIGARTWRDIQAQLWLAEHALRTPNYSKAFLHLDMALRRDAALAPVVFPVLTDALADRRAAAPLAVRLAENPTWRAPFLAALPQAATPDQAEALLRALRAAGGRPTDAEVGGLLGARLAENDYRGARASWVAFLPAQAAHRSESVYDGDFKGLPGAPPFNWRLTNAGGVVAEIAEAPDGRPALHVQFSPARRHVLTEQLIALQPGSYRLTAQVRGQSGALSADLAWRVSCVGAPVDMFAEALVAADASEWRTVSLVFDVPAGGCNAQWLRLTNSARDSFDVADAWLAGLRIEKL